MRRRVSASSRVSLGISRVPLGCQSCRESRGWRSQRGRGSIDGKQHKGEKNDLLYLFLLGFFIPLIETYRLGRDKVAGGGGWGVGEGMGTRGDGEARIVNEKGKELGNLSINLCAETLNLNQK